MIVCLTTAQPDAALYLYDGTNRCAEYTWYVHRTLASTLLVQIEDFLQTHQYNWQDIQGVVVDQGPGSFTGLRIGCTVVNTIAYARDIAIVGASGENWISDGVDRLLEGANDRLVTPFYGAEPRITAPKK